jgi:hypothetical protein
MTDKPKGTQSFEPAWPGYVGPQEGPAATVWAADERPLKHVAADAYLASYDDLGFYAINTDAPAPWPSDEIHVSLDDPCAEQTAAELELLQHQVNLDDLVFHHSTSWRSEPLLLVTHFLAIVRCPESKMVREVWPWAKPISPRLADKVGPPRPHGALGPPEEVRDIDVWRHAFRHAAYLTDPTMWVTLHEGEPNEMRLRAPDGAIAYLPADALWLGTDDEDLVAETEATTPELIVRAQHTEGYDAEIAAKLPAEAARHLVGLRPATAWMFGRLIREAA